MKLRLILTAIGVLLTVQQNSVWAADYSKDPEVVKTVQDIANRGISYDFCNVFPIFSSTSVPATDFGVSTVRYLDGGRIEYSSLISFQSNSSIYGKIPEIMKELNAKGICGAVKSQIMCTPDSRARVQCDHSGCRIISCDEWTWN